MSELTDLIWVEKYRPQKFEDLILDNKEDILYYIYEKPKQIPSLLLHSAKPGTGKTSLAKLIIKELGCDSITINASDERGIDTIREKIKLFAQSLSSDKKIKRCVFMDEADSLTRTAMDSMRNLMETYSDNCFFILSCNDISKIIEPLRSRCLKMTFEKPDKMSIKARLTQICKQEDLKVKKEEIDKLVTINYPDIRSMIMALQEFAVNKKPLVYDEMEYIKFFKLLKDKRIKEIYDIVFSGKFNLLNFNRWFFKTLFNKVNDKNWQKIGKITYHLAEIEKSWSLQANLEIVFIANMFKIMDLL